MTKGVPYSEALNMHPWKREAYVIAFGDLERGAEHRFDFETWDWPEIKA